MITCTLTIRVHEGRERDALRTLSTIEHTSVADPGCVAFRWLQDEQDPYRFVLFEQWRTRADLDAHLAKDPSVWEAFVPGLDGAPQPATYRQVVDMASAPDDAEVRELVARWFDLLSAHAPVEQILPLVSDHELEMVFPETTMTDEAQVRSWYTNVGRAYTEQSHTLVRLDVTAVADIPAADVDLEVVWRARRTSDGAQLAFRAHQTWQVVRSFAGGVPVIERYRVQSLRELEQLGAGGPA